LLLGAWLAGTLVVAWVATSNFTAADHLLASAPQEIQKTAAALSPAQSRMLLRFLVSVENANYFLTWELVEFGLLIALGAVLVTERQTRMLVIFPAVLLLLVSFQHFRLTREIIWLGQEMVLAGGSASERIREEFGIMHSMYGIAEVVKLVLAVVLAVWIVIRRSGRKARAAAQPLVPAPASNRRYAG